MSANNRYIDAHLHLQDERFSPSTISEIMHRAALSGVERMFCNATSEDDWLQVLKLAAAYSSIVPSLGVHPWLAGSVTPGWQKRLAALCQKAGAAIGEIGLDKSSEVSMDIQEGVFCAQLDIALQEQAMVSIHCVQKWGRLLEILQKKSLPKNSIIIHSFSGSTQIMDRLLELGAFISFSTQLGNPARKKIHQAFLAVPINRLLLETDSPDQLCKHLNAAIPPPLTCGSEPINEPAIIPFLYQHAAKMLNISPTTLAEKVWENSNHILTRNLR